MTGRIDHSTDTQSADTAPAPRIMVVDDSPVNLTILDDLLCSQGYRVFPFADGPRALRAAARMRPDLILLDIMMPEMHGFEVCRQLKDDPRLHDIPVIFISALDDIEDKVRAFAEGGVDYVTKPFHAEEVLARVNAHLAIGALQRQLQAHNADLERLVARRTRELDEALSQLMNVSRLKDSFLSMIGHELCTPANGILGIGELLIELCPDSEDLRAYGEVFRHSGQRLRNLIDDALMLANLDDEEGRGPPGIADPLSCATLLDEFQNAHPTLRIDRDAAADLEHRWLRANPRLLRKALDTLVALAACFSGSATPMRMVASTHDAILRLRFDLDALPLTPEQTAEFFQLESMVRAASAAQGLALAPVVAQRILAACGGDLTLVKHAEQTGALEATLHTDTQ